jgi:hypothetical protein
MPTVKSLTDHPTPLVDPATRERRIYLSDRGVTAIARASMDIHRASETVANLTVRLRKAEAALDRAKTKRLALLNAGLPDLPPL